MYRIRTYNNISEKGLSHFSADRYEVGPDLSEPDAFMLRSQKLHDEVMPDSVVAVGRAGAGVNNIPVDRFSHKGIVVFNAPGANANAVKELVTAAMILGSRDIFGGMNFVQKLNEMTDAAEMAKLLEKEKKQFRGGEISGKTLGVVGLGAIGARVANMGLELGMKVAGYDPALSVEAAWALSSQVEKVDSFEALLGISDFVTLHVPANEHTRHLINSGSLKRFRKGAKLLNFARGEIVDNDAVIEALDSGRLSGFVSDFPVPELLGRKDTLLLPHIGASTREAEENCSVMVADQLVDFLENGNIHNSVNFPRTRMRRTEGASRITFCNENVPRVLVTVLNQLADRNINIIDMVNKSQGDMAYNIIDLDQKPGDGVIDDICATEGVIHVRVI
jgi:D-3-phosphoglycerate dehydrogenase